MFLIVSHTSALGIGGVHGRQVVRVLVEVAQIQGTALLTGGAKETVVKIPDGLLFLFMSCEQSCFILDLCNEILLLLVLGMGMEKLGICVAFRQPLYA